MREVWKPQISPLGQGMNWHEKQVAPKNHVAFVVHGHIQSASRRFVGPRPTSWVTTVNIVIVVNGVRGSECVCDFYEHSAGNKKGVPGRKCNVLRLCTAPATSWLVWWRLEHAHTDRHRILARAELMYLTVYVFVSGRLSDRARQGWCTPSARAMATVTEGDG